MPVGTFGPSRWGGFDVMGGGPASGGLYGGAYGGRDPNRHANELFQQAQDWLNQNPDVWGPYGGQLAAEQSPWAQQAAGMLGGIQAPGSFLSGDIAAYMNPYQQQVIDQSLSDIDRARQMAVNTGARSAGASTYGGSRNALVESETNRNYADAQARTAAQLRSAGFDAAAGLMSGDLNRQLQGNQQQIQSAGLMGQLGYQDQAFNQQGLDRLYQDWMRSQMGPMQGFNFLAGLNSQNQYQPGSPFSGLLGLGATALGTVFGGPAGGAAAGSLMGPITNQVWS